ncbi:MAG: hypothetical protein ACKN9W_17140 [Methylococcus sp.]
MNNLSKHPWLIFGVGLVIGFYAHKHRKEIIKTSCDIVDKGKCLVKRQSENLGELVAFKHH